MPSPRRMHSTFTIFSNCSIILPGFKFTELHTLTLAAHSYALLWELIARSTYIALKNIWETPLQIPVIHQETLWDNMGNYVTLWDTKRCHETPWGNMRNDKISWGNMRYRKRLWHAMRHHRALMRHLETWWDAPHKLVCPVSVVSESWLCHWRTQAMISRAFAVISFLPTPPSTHTTHPHCLLSGSLMYYIETVCLYVCV